MPASLGGIGLITRRLETTKHFPTWQTAQGAFPVGRRWSSTGRRMIYTLLEPSPAIVEVGVHKSFDTRDRVLHTLLEIEIVDPTRVDVVDLTAIPNPHWLHPGAVSAGQQAFGDVLRSTCPMVICRASSVRTRGTC